MDQIYRSDSRIFDSKRYTVLLVDQRVESVSDSEGESSSREGGTETVQSCVSDA